MHERYDILCLSPHLDDAALSCGGMLAKEVRRGAGVLVVTTMAGDAPVADLGPYARELVAASGLKPETAMEARRKEDAESCRIMGVDFAQWPYRECVARRRPGTGEWLYPTVQDALGTVAPEDAGLVDALAADLGKLPPVSRILAPLGVGGHVDHRIVRSACERVFGRNVEFYEDFPYAQRFGAVWRTLRNPFAWSRAVVSVDETDVVSWINAVRVHASQTGVMFHGDADMEFKIRRHVRRRGGQRLWRRRA